MSEQKPIILYEGQYDLSDLDKLKNEQHIWNISDIYLVQLQELFEVQNPSLVNSPDYKSQSENFIKLRQSQDLKLQGNWIYFPWSGVLLHTLNEDEVYTLKTNRNKNLITSQEQEKLYNTTIAIVGLSVGSSLAVGLSYQGIAKNLKLAEFDILETTNLNRIRAGLQHVGQRKIDIVTQQVYEINPFAQITTYPQGLTQNNLEEFVTNDPKPRVIFEIIDDFEMKIRLRLLAKKYKIPVITPANLGDNILLDIERYDTDLELSLFNGILGKLPEEILNNPNEDKNKYAVQMVGLENIPQRALDSVKEIGKTLIGRPQLSSTVAISSALGAYLARRIILDKQLTSGRRLISFNKILSIIEDLE